MKTETTERPILFSAPMVLAILDGRKTKTRRILKPQPPSDSVGIVCCDGGKVWADYGMGRPDASDLRSEWKCPYGKVGDRLWCREAHYIGGGNRVRYRASPEVLKTADGLEQAIGNPPKKWRPSIHMHRWASRLTLEITGIKVERVQSISEEDARAEGCKSRYCSPDDTASCPKGSMERALAERIEGGFLTAKNDFASLWESINGKQSWAKNVWVWCVSFKRI